LSAQIEKQIGPALQFCHQRGGDNFLFFLHHNVMRIRNLIYLIPSSRYQFSS
jgi:hypothetical protein